MRNCRRKFIKKLRPEKRKENMYQTTRFKSRLNYKFKNIFQNQISIVNQNIFFKTKLTL